MKKCILCGEMSEGSIGAAGFKLEIICQQCRDIEDNLLANQLKSIAPIVKTLWGGKND